MSQMLDELSNYIFVSKYARYNEKLKRRETWEEAVGRVEEMHLKKFDNLSIDAKTRIRAAFDLVREKKVVPSMRSMQFGGPAVESHEARIFNCSVLHIDSIRSFAEVFYLLLCGCGVGMGLTDFFLGRLPDLVDANDKTGTVLTYVIEDTIEGWADSLQALLNCYFKNSCYSGRKIVFDYSRIRRKGAKLKIGGGKAPGYKPLKNAHVKIKELLDSIIEEKGQTRLKTINAYDILMHCSDAVLSGGVRRSATCVVFNKNDKDMMDAKTGEWYKDNPQRGRSNNSVLLIRDKTTKEEFNAITEKTKQWGEPGFVFANHEWTMYNPCVRGDTIIPVIGQGYVRIDSVVDQEVETWNGFEWVRVIPKITGTNQPMLKITLSNGKFLVCTRYHKWYIDIPEGELNPEECKEVEAQDLKIGDAPYYFMGEPMQPCIISIEDAGIDAKVYCFNESKRHLGMFNGIITGQCFEIGFLPVTDDGRCGVQFCNLTSINGAKIKNKEDYKAATEAATIIGTLQASYTHFPYLDKTAEFLTKQEALLGVSITGIMDSSEILLDKNSQKEMAKFAVEINKTWAKILGINEAARITCIKPEGTTSLALGCSSGIHCHTAHKYFRRVRANKDDNIFKFFKKHNPHMCEEAAYNPNKTDEVITFPLTIPQKAITKDQLTAIEHLEIIKSTQQNWVLGGETGNNKKDVTHNVSCTVVVKPEEWPDVINYIYKNKDFFSAVALLASTGDKDYVQAPLEKITTEDDKKKFALLNEKYKEMDYTKLLEDRDETAVQDTLACGGGKCEL